MDTSSKKVSFGFSKLKKTSQLVKQVPVEKKEVEFVDSFDGDKGKFSYQGTRLEEEVKKLLVIPLVGTRTAYEVIKAKLDEKKETNENSEDVKPSLDVLAAREILSGINNEECDENETKPMVIVTDVEKPTFEGEKESSLEDYENIPVDDFGLAMLRGMGWTLETGIGKDSRVVAPITTELRPRRLGLGAQCPKAPAGRLPLAKGSFIEILAGLHKNSVGVVEALDGDTGSVFIKLTGGKIVSISENWVAGLSPKEYERKLNGDQKPDPKSYGIVKKEAKGDEKKSSSQLAIAMKLKKKHKRKSSSPEPQRRHRSRSRDRHHKKSKKHRSRSSSDEDRRKKSKNKHRR